MRSPIVQIVVGGLAMVLATALAFLMVLGLIPATLLLSLVAFGLSMGGLVLGLAGMSHLVRLRSRDDDGP